MAIVAVFGGFVLLSPVEGSDANDGVAVLSGEGTSENPFLIKTVEDLRSFRDDVNSGNDYSGKVVRLDADLDLGGETWIPISLFSGLFDGNGHRISDFRIDATDSRGGFFNEIAGYNDLDDVRVKDLTLSDVSATVGNNRFGTLANLIKGVVHGVTVENISVVTTHTDAWVGGMCAFMYWPWMTNCTVRNMVVDAPAGAEFIAGFACILQKNSNYVFDNLDVEGFVVNVTDAKECGVAGFVGQTQRGWEYPKVVNCDVSGIDITATGAVQVGGFIAWPGAHTTAENCTTQGRIDVTGVDSKSYAGGFLGDLGWNCDLGHMGHDIRGCIADVDITTKYGAAGGFVGSATNSNNTSMYAEFTGCTALGDITCVEGGTASIGGFAGEADRGTYIDCAFGGVVTNNGTGYDGGFIGHLMDVTPKYDSRFPSGTREYPANRTMLDGCSHPDDTDMIGYSQYGVLLVYGECDHVYSSDATCIDRTCQKCGHVPEKTPHNSDASHPCMTGHCTMCGSTVDARTAHELDSEATCIDRTCGICGTVVKATTHHDYRPDGYRLVCSMCGNTIVLPMDDDDDDAWYLEWLAQQQHAQQEAERLAKEKADKEQKEEQKRVAAVALAIGAAVVMVLLLASTYRKE